MSTQQPNYDTEFVSRAVELCRMSERPRVQVAADLGISSTTLGRWMKQSSDNQDDEVLTTSERDELMRLRKEKREWVMEREILKEATTAFWVKESGQ